MDMVGQAYEPPACDDDPDTENTLWKHVQRISKDFRKVPV